MKNDLLKICFILFAATINNHLNAHQFEHKECDSVFQTTREMMNELEALLGTGMRVRQLPYEADENGGYRIALVQTPECKDPEGVDKVLLWNREEGLVLTVKSLVTHRDEGAPYYAITALVTDGQQEGEVYVQDLHLTLRVFLDGEDILKNRTGITWKTVKGMKYKDLKGNTCVLDGDL